MQHFREDSDYIGKIKTIFFFQVQKFVYIQKAGILLYQCMIFQQKETNKGGFFQKVRFVFHTSKSQKKIPNHYPELEI